MNEVPGSIPEFFYWIVVGLLVPVIVALWVKMERLEKEKSSLQDARLKDVRDMLVQSNDAMNVVDAAMDMTKNMNADLGRLNERFNEFRTQVLSNQQRMMEIIRGER